MFEKAQSNNTWIPTPNDSRNPNATVGEISPKEMQDQEMALAGYYWETDAVQSI